MATSIDMGSKSRDVLQNAATATGNGTAFDSLEKYNAVLCDFLFVSGSSGTITWEISADNGTTWTGTKAQNIATLASALTATTAGVYLVPTMGAGQFRARISAISSATITVYGKPMYIPGMATSGVGTGATDLGKAEDAAHASGDTGVMMLGVRESSPTDLSAGATNGDYEPLQVDANGQLWVALGSAGVTTKSDGAVTATATALKASAGTLIELEVSNINTVDLWLQLFDLAVGSVTLGTTAPKLSFTVPKGDGTSRGILIVDPTIPILFSTAITYALTTTRAGSTAPGTAGEANFVYI